MQDQKQHVIIAICSLIIGNNISDRRDQPSKEQPKALPAPESKSSSEVPVVTAVPEISPVPSEKLPKQSSKRIRKAERGIQTVLGKAAGTLFLAWMVWKVFGRKRSKTEQ